MKKESESANKILYRQLCEQYDLPLFMQYWWLEGVCAGKDWDVLLVRDNDDSNKIIAAMPYEVSKRLWIRIVCQSELTPYGGIWIHPEWQERPHIQELVCSRIDELLHEKHLAALHLRFGIDSPFPSLLEKQGYRIVGRRTYILPDTRLVADLRAAFSRNKRKKLEQAIAKYQVEDIEAEEFYRFHAATSAQKNISLWYTREMLLVMWEKAETRGQARLIGIRDQEGELLAAAFVIWDAHCAYQLLNTFDHDSPDNGARELLTLEVIKQANIQGVPLDFTFHKDYLKHYGAQRRNYFAVHAGSMPMVTLTRLLNWFEDR